MHNIIKIINKYKKKAVYTDGIISILDEYTDRFDDYTELYIKVQKLAKNARKIEKDLKDDMVDKLDFPPSSIRPELDISWFNNNTGFQASFAVQFDEYVDQEAKELASEFIDNKYGIVTELDGDILVIFSY